jgi:fatty-acyl-CoA synthase
MVAKRPVEIAGLCWIAVPQPADPHYTAPGVQVAVLDGSNRQVPTGKIGEVCIQGPNVTKGYLNRPEANKEAYAGVQLVHQSWSC